MARRKNKREQPPQQGVSGTVQHDEDAAAMAELKEFVKEMRHSKGRSVEMRLAVLGSIVIIVKLFYFEGIFQSEAAYGVFFFLLVTLLVIILSTWLDYFPSRQSFFKLREAQGQGLPLACLLSSMVCAAVLCYSVQHRPELTGLLSIYLMVCCTLGLITIIPTALLHVPSPNSAVVYQLLVLVLIALINRFLGVSLAPLLVASTVYSTMVPLLLHNFPESFTLCEVSLVSQSAALLVTDFVLQLAVKLEFYDVDGSVMMTRSESTLFLEMGIAGFFFCCLVLWPFLYKTASSEIPFYSHLWSLMFLQTSFLIAVFLFLPVLELLIGKPPLLWLFKFVFQTKERVVLVIYWMCVTLAAGIMVVAQGTQTRWLSFLRVRDPSSLWMRKWFHVLATFVYVPGIAFDMELLSLSSFLVTLAFLVIELIRLFRMWPLGELLHGMLVPFVDSRDSGDLIVTHTYPLLGFSIPLWLFPLVSQQGVGKLAIYSGVLALGVGDSVAAVSGTLMGRNKWSGTNKTMEGSFMAFGCQILFLLLILFLDPDVPPLSALHWVIVTATISATVALEAFTRQIDNLVLGAYLFALLIALM